MSLSMLTSSFTMVKSLLNSFNGSTNSETVINDNSSESSHSLEETVNVSAENVPDFLDISPKQQSVTIHIAQHMFTKVQNVLDTELDLIKSNTQHGAIYKTKDNSVTATLYTTTSNLNIQGRAVFTWTDLFVAKCEHLDVSDPNIILSSQPRSSTPLPNIHLLFDSTFEASDIKEDCSVSTTDVKLPLVNEETISKCNRFDGKDRYELISIIHDLESKLFKGNEQLTVSSQNKPTNNAATQTDDQTVPDEKTNQNTIATQTTPIPAPRLFSNYHSSSHEDTITSSTSTQTSPIPATRPSLMKKKVEENRKPDQTLTKPSILGQKYQKTNSSKQSDKTLIIGSSILKGIKTSQLSKTHVQTIRGAVINRITEEIMKKDLQPYQNIILQVGGNDISAGISRQEFEDNYESLLLACRAFSNSDCNIIVSGIPPRANACVYQANLVLENLCQFYGVIFIKQYEMFMQDAYNLNSCFYSRDGIHLNYEGTWKYLKTINNIISIIKGKVKKCLKCGEENHSTEHCRHEHKLRCQKCGNFGHKLKHCKI